MDLTNIGAGWELLAVCGHPMTEGFAGEWFGGKTKGEWQQSKPLGVGARIDHLQRITSLHLFGPGAEKGTKPFAGSLPGGLSWTSTRVAVNALFGPPTASGEPSGEPTSIMFLPYPWDRWDIPGKGGLHVAYVEDASSVRMITLSEPAQPEATSFDLQVYADYSQFYVADTASTCDTSVIWDDPETTKRQIACGNGLIAIGTKRYGTVPVRIEIYPLEPKLEPKGIDRINECGLTITTSLGVGNYVSSPELAPIEIAPGTYGVRALYIFQDQVENDETGSDQYVLQFWPVTEPLVLRYVKPPAKTPTKSATKKPSGKKPAASKKSGAKS